MSSTIQRFRIIARWYLISSCNMIEAVGQFRSSSGSYVRIAGSPHAKVLHWAVNVRCEQAAPQHLMVRSVSAKDRECARTISPRRTVSAASQRRSASSSN